MENESIKEEPGVNQRAKDDEYLKDQMVQLIKDEHSESEAFDKGILLLNTGAIGASLLLLGNVFTQPVAESVAFLLGAWAAFATSAVCNVTSHAASAKAFQRERIILEERRLGIESENPRWWHVWRWRFDIFAVNWLNRLSWISLIIGVCSLLYFGYLNVQGMNL